MIDNNDGDRHHRDFRQTMALMGVLAVVLAVAAAFIVYLLFSR
jgi:hypothetical protein